MLYVIEVINMILRVSQAVIKIFAEFEMWLFVFCNSSGYLGFLGIHTDYSTYLLLRTVVNELFLLTSSTVRHILTKFCIKWPC